MGIFQKINRYMQMDDQFEIDTKVGLSFQCVWVLILSVSYGIFYISIGLFELLYMMIGMFICSTAMLIYCHKDGRYRNLVVCVGIGVQSALVHTLVTLYLGNSGTVFFVISAMLIPHLYPLLKLRYMLTLDIMLVVAINLAFWISQNSTPIYADHVGNAYRFTLSNIGLAICLLALYVNIFSVNSLKKVRQRLVESASKDAYLDALTGLGNRRMLNRHQNSLESYSDAPMCVAMLDIDFFKKVNDTYGHAAGDEALVFFSETMKTFFRKSDMLIRWGGEEFLILFRFTSIDNAEALMERFRNLIEDSLVHYDGGDFKITVTIGLTEHRFGTSLNDTITLADELLYRGKVEGRNRIVMQTL